MASAIQECIIVLTMGICNKCIIYRSSYTQSSIGRMTPNAPFVSRYEAIWVKWFLETSASKWKAAPRYYYKTTYIYISFSSNQPSIKIKPKFYQNIQNYWLEARTVDNTNIKVEMIQEQVIWNNQYITISKHPFTGKGGQLMKLFSLRTCWEIIINLWDIQKLIINMT